MWRVRRRGLAAFAVLLATSTTASRDCRASAAASTRGLAPAASVSPPEPPVLPPAWMEPPGRHPSEVAWQPEWPRVRHWEYVTTAAFMSAGFWLRFAGPGPPDNWRGGILFDEAVQRALAIDDPGAAQAVSSVTDVLFYGSMIYRLVDSAVVPWIGYGDADLALQMSMIDLSAFSVQSLVLWGSQTLIGRTRPIVLRCDGDARLDERCRDPSELAGRRSFIAGHTATGVTAAGLTCLHHSRIPLYGGWGDGAACAATIVAAAINGYGRVATESHYATDVVFGVGLGLLSGWVLPAALHYGFRSGADTGRVASTDARMGRVMVLPRVRQHSLGMALTGRF